MVKERGLTEELPVPRAGVDSGPKTDLEEPTRTLAAGISWRQGAWACLFIVTTTGCSCCYTSAAGCMDDPVRLDCCILHVDCGNHRYHDRHGHHGHCRHHAEGCGIHSGICHTIFGHTAAASPCSSHLESAAGLQCKGAAAGHCGCRTGVCFIDDIIGDFACFGDGSCLKVCFHPEFSFVMNYFILQV